eukprot:CAMPEP_0203748274 /NCGR_PEP_ID=MMETSP0098-20131031/3203_1 /ASSEMBLY_ACC=CAM_ASM_000208 /TAXON_ID=96639 /ORGANISM=" , Strain NY0313808BC1" /LENGTH=187 /DNA_ID=CAMNT_0050636969 /DNA_START=435 /DNA_END=995 /DNA_ORIENTATION=+
MGLTGGDILSPQSSKVNGARFILTSPKNAKAAVRQPIEKASTYDDKFTGLKRSILHNQDHGNLDGFLIPTNKQKAKRKPSKLNKFVETFSVSDLLSILCHYLDPRLDVCNVLSVCCKQLRQALLKVCLPLDQNPKFKFTGRHFSRIHNLPFSIESIAVLLVDHNSRGLNLTGDADIPYIDINNNLND